MLVYHVMPNTCSVFGCKSNYRGHPSATVFKLPSASCDLKDKWIRVLHRDMATELLEDKIFICIYHFREEDIIRVDQSKLMVPTRKHHVLGQLTVLTRYQFFSKAARLIYLNCSENKAF